MKKIALIATFVFLNQSNAALEKGFVSEFTIKEVKAKYWSFHMKRVGDDKVQFTSRPDTDFYADTTQARAICNKFLMDYDSLEANRCNTRDPFICWERPLVKVDSETGSVIDYIKSSSYLKSVTCKIRDSEQPLTLDDFPRTFALGGDTTVIRLDVESHEKQELYESYSRGRRYGDHVVFFETHEDQKPRLAAGWTGLIGKRNATAFCNQLHMTYVGDEHDYLSGPYCGRKFTCKSIDPESGNIILPFYAHTSHLKTIICKDN